MTKEEFALHIEEIKYKLYRTALLYLGNETLAADAVDESVYKALCSLRKLRQPEYFDTWMIRILINECYKELKRQKQRGSFEEFPETAKEDFDGLPLKEAIAKLPKELKEVIILRYFSGYTLVETASILKIPQGTTASRQRRALSLLRLELEEEVAE